MASDRIGPCTVLRTVMVSLAAAADLDGLGAHRQRDLLAVAQVGVAPHLLEEEVADVGAEVGEPPGDRLVVADDDAGQARRTSSPRCRTGTLLPTVRQCRPTWYQMPGMLTPRWGSLASNGFPVLVRRPETTHELEPMPSPRPIVTGTASSAGERLGTPRRRYPAAGARRRGAAGAGRPRAPVCGTAPAAESCATGAPVGPRIGLFWRTGRRVQLVDLAGIEPARRARISSAL